jgi:hypothetical protein
LPQPRRMRPQPAISSYGEPIAGTASTMPTMRPLITSGGRGHASAISCGSRAPGAPDFAPPSSETCVFLGFSGGGSTPLGVLVRFRRVPHRQGPSRHLLKLRRDVSFTAPFSWGRWRAGGKHRL